MTALRVNTERISVIRYPFERVPITSSALKNHLGASALSNRSWGASRRRNLNPVSGLS
ncbi:hypothetical protein HDA32_005218 [Spinactinospora alkalitolerans]|uniref:Uncharacterized protein n=1 Tax=Spinactinospora alkalitolerans TaxID=687207 RepID=A0A852U1J6_9ACTN|nr:hypothetical protein [Spinactinospora alkalitolerans]